MFFVVGATEMVYSALVFFGFKMDEEGYYVNTFLFGLGASLELIFWMLTRFSLGKLYMKTYGFYRSCLANFSTLAFQSFLTIFPTDMLLFFGYEGTN
mmetsp:Transcript_6827/g.5083  ORF Transcript_6827/g.5083 Transcript_6827/m.5083 type:complete len:97 (+) Transcript_6827:233-523(+)